MTSISSQPAVASPAATAPAPPDGAAPASDLHPALVALVRLLARQAVREWLAQPETAEPRRTHPRLTLRLSGRAP